MGLCFSRKQSTIGSNRSIPWWRKEDCFDQDGVLAGAILFQQNGTVAFVRSSTSLRSFKSNTALARCSTSTSQSLTHLLNKTNHFVLVHGAWCWYKTIAPLEHAGFKDLTGSGVHSFDTNSITSLSQYAKPLIAFLENLAHGHKLYPSKVSKAIFVAATMLTSGQSALDIFSEKTKSNDLTRQSQIFIYANGNDKPPTAIDLDKSLMKDLLFNHSPARYDVALASVSMRPIPFSPVLEKLSLSDIKYGSIRRFYIETTEDNAIPIALQQYMISQNPPERVFHVKGADHSPFFSKPQALHRILVEISTVSSTSIYM
ncbi:hypothetical protein R3W88_007914 [Solanum pinnatisectum]|uniref:Methylketone synthase Ib n=1 Tax=Solanum pinnatisectum TaxID=50273 RepID=A0AAV9M7E4_9SOLN|nr:hypothetical protein R3W88_007914 [Solanum pinnatisectum]